MSGGSMIEREDTISRKDALKALDYDIKSFEFKSGVGRHMNEIANLLNTIYEIQSDNIKALPTVQPKYNTDEWCHDCSEYNQDKHCCPRYNKVIRNTVEEMKQTCEDAISRAETQTAIEMIASRYTLAREHEGMGQAEWSDQLIKVSDAVDIIRHLPSVTLSVEPQESEDKE